LVGRVAAGKEAESEKDGKEEGWGKSREACPLHYKILDPSLKMIALCECIYFIAVRLSLKPTIRLTEISLQMYNSDYSFHQIS